jgi:membrane fusion protein, multidrug efflux system
MSMQEARARRDAAPAAAREEKNPYGEPGGHPSPPRFSGAGGPPPETASNARQKTSPRRGRRAYMVLASAVVVGLAASGGYAYVSRDLESTDDARIEADVITVSPRVGGQVVRVAVVDNQPVNLGDLLVEIDPAPYRARVEQAEAELAIAQANVKVAQAEVTISAASSEGGLTAAHAGVSNAELSIQGADAQVLAAQAALERAQAQVRELETDLERARHLSQAGTIAAAELGHRESEAEVARARVREQSAQLAVAQDQARAARARVSETRGRLRQSEPVAAQLERSKAQFELAQARVKSAQAAVELARLDLQNTRALAPASGSVTRLPTRPGQTVQPGQLLVYLVPQGRYVVANFKETQIGRMRAGQRVDVEVDAYPGRTFEAHIDSITSGTGSRFSLLPADNATGNFVKVVQRVPVRIVWNGKAPEVPLEPGMSVIAEVHLR